MTRQLTGEMKEKKTFLAHPKNIEVGQEKKFGNTISRQPVIKLEIFP